LSPSLVADSGLPINKYKWHFALWQIVTLLLRLRASLGTVDDHINTVQYEGRPQNIYYWACLLFGPQVSILNSYGMILNTFRRDFKALQFNKHE
jgi:hypothetical protein